MKIELSAKFQDNRIFADVREKDIKTKERRSAADRRNSFARKLSAACRKIAFVGMPLMRLYCRDGNSLNSLMPHYGERPHVLRQTANDPPTTFLESAAVGSPADSTLAREKDPFLIPRRVSPLIVFTFREATPFAFHTLRHEIHLAIREIPTIRQTLDIHPYTSFVSRYLYTYLRRFAILAHIVYACTLC